MLKLFRYKNLIFIVLIQWLIYYSVISPILQKFGLALMLPSWCFWLLVIATVMISTGGYIINDYFDVKIDQINRPDDVVIGKSISKKTAMTLYMVISGIGVLLGLFVSIWLKNTTLGFIFIVVTGMLWFYSSSYKRQFLIGNLIVALSCALSILVLLVAESSLQSNYYGELIRQTPVLPELYRWVCSYAAFAFMLTLIREIIKDMEDIKGDKEVECRTLPIVWGERNAKTVVTCLLSISLILLFFLVNKLNLPNDSGISLRYFLFGIALPSILVIIFLWSKKMENNYKNAGNLIKFIMLIGILYSLCFYYLTAKAYHLAMFGIFNIV